ncbi:MAG: hypothetical protein M1824_001407 [Vezdaea acicularis]|nr:MAG: hypothetical protein M1824_001407 [Vezdaea acicularis]
MSPPPLKPPEPPIITRRPSPGDPSTRPPKKGLLPSPIPDNVTIPDTSHPAADETPEQQETDTEQPQAEAPIQGPPFYPFFTLIETPHSTPHHPTVHYIFSDDTTDLISEAAVRSLPHRPTSSSSSLHQSNTPSHPSNSSQTPSTLLPPPRRGVKERYILLDISASGDEVVSARSLSEDWQVLGVDVGPAPAWEGEEDGNRGLMVRIEGVESAAGKEVEGTEKLEELAALFERRMGELRRVVEEGRLGGFEMGGEKVDEVVAEAAA